ncbi:glycosyltransferase [Aquipuribacter sp. MA13-6]|uniref:glycosyltransferase n=1 Tax=unclassified Aquipuribacter TaxID=2635084 RepID=UPI003EEFE9D3
MTLVVVVVTYNSAEIVVPCLRSLAVASEGLDVDVRVVDNDSTDDTVARVEAFGGDVRVIRTGANLGYAAAINAGCADAGDQDDLLVLNPDVVLHPGCVRALLESRGADDTVGVVAPVLRAPDGRLQPSRRREPSIRRALGEAALGARASAVGPGWSEVVRTPLDGGPGTADWVTGAALLVTAACRRDVGEWDESFFLYSEETDYCLRARDRGWSTRVEARAVAVHTGGESMTDPRLYALLTRNRARLFRKRHGPVRSGAFWLVLLLGEVGRAAAGRATSAEAVRVLLGRSVPVSATPRTPGATPLVCFAGVDWWYQSRAHSDVQLMVHAARGRPVLHVNSIGLRMPTRANTTRPVSRVLRKLGSIARLLRQPLAGTPGFHVLSPVVLPFYEVDSLRRLNAVLVRAQVSAACRWLRIRRPAFVVTLPTAYDVVASMDRTALVYNRSDKHSEFPEADKDVLLRLEGALLDEADTVLYASQAFLASEAGRVGARGVFLDHGVDLDHFRARTDEPPPADIAHLTRPLIGFFGAVDDYTVDVPLLEAVADRYPAATLLLIGSSNVDLSALTARPNVTWLGPRPYDEIPRYGTAFDVALMPWLQNDWIESCNPIKCKEYLALGLPVVTTRYAQAAAHADVLRIADGHEEFLAEVGRVLNGDRPSPEACRAAVADASWAARAATLCELVDEMARP